MAATEPAMTREGSGLFDTFRKWYRLRPEPSSRRSTSISVKMLHSFYRSLHPSGENETVRQQVDLLASGGIDVELIYVSSDDLEPSLLGKALVATEMIGGIPSVMPPYEWLQDADVIHIHNTFPGISHGELMDLKVPKIITAHNYRAFCANGLFLRDGARCMDCASHGPARAVLHGCYQGSRVKSIPIALQQRSSRSLVALMNKCHRVLLPGEGMRSVYEDLGVKNMEVLHNPVATPPLERHANFVPESWLFVGRISAEKGLADLLRVWPHEETLLVVGEGSQRPLAEEIAAERGLSVQFFGARGRDSVQELLARSQALVFPSLALEGAPLVYGEAMQVGVPVVASEGTTLAAQVLSDKTGETFSLHNPATLVRALESIKRSRSHYEQRAQRIYLQRYTPSVWIDRITKIYEATASTVRQA